MMKFQSYWMLNIQPDLTKVDILPPDLSEIIDIDLMLKSLLPKEVKTKITIGDFRLKSNLTTNKTIRFTKKPFFCNFSFYSIPFR